MNRKKATLAIHGNKSNKGKTGAVVTPIYQTSTFCFPDSEAVKAYTQQGERKHYLYTRYGNPTTTVLENKLALLEETEAAVVAASGMAVVTGTLNALVEKGDEVITIPTLYGNTFNFISEDLPKQDINVKFVEIEDLYNLDKIVTEKTKLIFFESPTNPLIQVVDFEKVATAAKKHNIITITDSTFGSPINQNPIKNGIDIVIHSMTKYLGGHSDVVAGCVMGPKDIIDKIRRTIIIHGGSIDPFASFLLLRSLLTLKLRVEEQNKNAMKLAEHFKGHKKVKRVLYPGLKDSPYYETASKQMSGYGGMVTLEVDGNAETVVDNLEIGLNGTSLGGVETLVSIPAITSQASLTEEERKKAGISRNMIRISVGIEDIEDLIADFEQGLEKI